MNTLTTSDLRWDLQALTLSDSVGDAFVKLVKGIARKHAVETDNPVISEKDVAAAIEAAMLELGKKLAESRRDRPKEEVLSRDNILTNLRELLASMGAV